jgi:PAS domain S-box-containing protein
MIVSKQNFSSPLPVSSKMHRVTVPSNIHMTRLTPDLSGTATGVSSIAGLSILVIEDDAGDFGLVKAEFRHVGLGSGNTAPRLHWAQTLADGLASAREALPDVVLLDLALPDSFGVATLEAVVAALPGVPVVIFTGSDDDALAIAAIEAGAQDYLVKGQFDRYALKRALRNALLRRRMEQSLHLFKSALNSAADGVEITDAAGRIEWVNQAFTQMTGYPAAEVIGHTPGELLRSGVQDQAFYQQMWETILSGNVWRGEVVNRRRDGSLYDEMLSIAPVTTAGGSIRNFVAIKQDISERKLIEQRLTQSEQRLELALASSDLGMWDLDISSGNEVTNVRWHEIIGYSPAGTPDNLADWEKLIHPDDRATTRAKLDAYIKGDVPNLEYEYRIRHQDGHWVWILARGKIVSRDGDGNPLRIVGTNLDISHQQRIRQDGADLLQRIEELVRQAGVRPGQLSNAADSQGNTPAHPPQLSERQREVLKLVATGCTSAEIAQRLNIKPATVVTHRRDLMQKLDLHSVAALTRYAIEHGLGSGK